MSQQYLKPNLTSTNVGPWTSTPDAGSSLNLHLNIDGATWTPVEFDDSDWITSAGGSSSCSFRFENLATPDAGKKWSHFRLAVWGKDADGTGTVYYGATLSVGGIGQNEWTFGSAGFFGGSQTQWTELKSFDYSQAQLDATEVLLHFVPPYGFFQGDVDVSGMQLLFQDAFIEVASGGTKAGGSAISSGQTFLEAGEGGGNVHGSSIISCQCTVQPSGGLFLGGTALPSVSVEGDVSGGVNLGGLTPPTTGHTLVGSGGVVVGGDFPLSFTGVGGVAIAGVAGAIATYIYNTSNEENDLQIGGSANPLIVVTMPAGGEVIVDGVAGLVVGYRYNATGGIGIAGVATGAVSRVNTKEFTFNIKTKQSIEPFEFNWNTGAIPLSHFRVISKCMPEDPEVCQPISDPEDLCLRHTVATITASTPADVCRQLSERGFKFPIVGFDRFTRPAQNEQLAADIASGDFNDCNQLVPVEFCEIPDCLEFCVDFDLDLLIEPIFEFDFTKAQEYVGDGTLVISGSAIVDFSINNSIVTEVVSGGTMVGGQGLVVTPFNRYVASGGIGVEGTVGGDGLKSSAYQASSGLCPTETIPAFFTAVDQRGVGSTWVDDNRIFASDDVKAYASVSDNSLTKELVGLNASIKIPEDKVVEGIIVEIEKSAGGSVFDNEIALVGPNGIKSENRAKPDLWPLTDEFIVHGRGDDSWGRVWTRDEVSSSEFGLSVKADSISSTPQNAFIDSIRISVAVCEEDGSGRVSIAGSAVQKSSHYSFTASGGLAVAGGLSTLAEYAYEADGGLNVAGSYAQSLEAGVVGTPDTEQMEIGGGLTPLDFKASAYNYDNFGGATGGTVVSSEFTELNIISSGWTWVAEEGVAIAGSADVLIGHKYVADDTPVLITGGFGQNFYYEGNGTIRVGPEFDQAVIPVFSRLAFSYGASGDGVTIGDSGAFIKFADLGTFEVDMEANFQIAEINAIFGSVDVGETAVPVDTVLTACGRGCIDLPLIIDMNHNLNQDNKLSQFLFRNDLVMDSVFPLNYNNTNDSWQANLHYTGVSSVGSRESWNIVFELQCSSFVSGVELGQSMLRFGVSVIQTNLDTGEDYDTRVISIFDPLSVCQRDVELIFKLTIDSKLKTTVVSPESTVQDTIVHDNIGLFKTGFWFENPEILFNVSEVGTELPARFIDVTPFVNY